ncbi:MAG: NAD(P)-dependent oxidoreductase [Pseudomonadota bacterium]
MTELRIGFIGLGLMGHPMAARLLAAGHALTVWNRTIAKAEALIAKGAERAETPAALAATTDIVCLNLTDTRAAEAVLFGSDGVATASGAGLVVDFSTIPPEVTKTLAARLQEANGMLWIDAPVSGGVPGAEAGTLTIMAGGPSAAFDRIRPILNAVAGRVTHMGDTGAGQATKLVNQIISGCTMAVVAEAVAYAERSGIDASRLTEALAGGFADSRPFQIFAPRMAASTFEEPLGTTDTMIKDLDVVASVGADLGARLPLTETALGIMRSSAAKGDGGLDIAAIVKEFRNDR